ncbi:MAG: hypothetical protein ACLFQX_11680 [Candidatus Kapaibacterium sp.]
MSSYNLGITGSWTLLILLILIGLALAIYTYRRTIPPVSAGKKSAMVILRSIGLALLLFVLFEPVLTTITGSVEPPRLAVLIDNSQSVAAEDAGGARKPLLAKAFANSEFGDLDEDQLRLFAFDSDVRKINADYADSLKYEGQMTDISAAIRQVARRAEDENIRAALIISDGEFNTGGNPIYDADVFGLPIFTIGIGDSTEPRDISVQTLLTNEIAYIDNPIPININIRVSGFDSGELKLRLFDGETKFAEQDIIISENKQNYSAMAEYTPKSSGYKKIRAEITSLEGELTTKNNSKTRFINVLKNKRRIALFAGAPSADVSFLRNHIKNDKSITLDAYIQRNGPQFYEQPTAQSLAEAEMIIMVGFPVSTTPEDALNMIASELRKDKPVMFIASSQTDYNKLKKLEDFLPFNVASSNAKEFMATMDVKAEHMASALLRITGAEEDMQKWNNLPPIYRTETFVRIKPESEVVAGFRVNNVPLNEPLIISRSIAGRKSLAIMGYGLYRWKLLGYAADKAKGRQDEFDLYNIFMNNALKWLSVEDIRKQVDIRTNKSSYISGESIEFFGQVYDAAYTPVDNATVTVRVTGGGESRELMLNPLGNGRYYSSIDGLPEADYEWQGSAMLGGNKLGSDAGRFAVGEIMLEYFDLKMNANLLRTLSERTGGRFYLPADAGAFLSDLQSHKAFEEKPITLRSEFALWNLPWLLAAAILCFGIEWFMRKRAGML